NGFQIWRLSSSRLPPAAVRRASVRRQARRQGASWPRARWYRQGSSKCSRLGRLTTPFADVLFEPDIFEQSAQALTERLGFSRLGANGGAQDFAHFLLGAPTMLSGTLLELRLHVVLEVANNQLSHDLASDMIS